MIKKFRRDNIDELSMFDVFKAVDGMALKPNQKIQRLFEPNDYRYRKGIVGCALSHIEMWLELLCKPQLKAMLVIEDDAQMTTNFLQKLAHVISISPEADIIFLSHHPYPAFVQENQNNKNMTPTTEVWNKNKCINQSMGGTTAYVIFRQGAMNMIKMIDKQGMRYAIDWEMMHSADVNKVYYCNPFIAFADCAQSGKIVDSDIQFSYDGVGFSSEKEFLRKEIEFWLKETCTSDICMKQSDDIVSSLGFSVKRKSLVILK
jgi:GR25 family glycosyltransferase involved in LPS biosynthesis